VEFGVFYNGKSINSGGLAIDPTHSKTYFRDIHLFLERAKDPATVRGATVRENLWMSLRGDTLKWHTAVLTEAGKRLVKYGANDTDLTEWSRLLIDRFGQPSYIAIDAVFKKSYTIKDAASRKIL
jgi:hypothetical protein